MTKEEKEKAIREAAIRGEVAYSTHAFDEQINDELNPEDILQALTTCEVIEDYPARTRRLPDCLVLSWLSDGTPLHACVGVDQAKSRILIITVYRPSPERWHDDWRTRKRT